MNILEEKLKTWESSLRIFDGYESVILEELEVIPNFTDKNYLIRLLKSEYDSDVKAEAIRRLSMYYH